MKKMQFNIEKSKITKERLLSKILAIKTAYGYDEYHSFGNGWYSSCKSEPMKGMISKNIENMPFVEFKDKWGGIQRGFIESVSIETTSKKPRLMYNIRTIETIGGRPNFIGILDISKVKILEGKIPNIEIPHEIFG